MNRHCGALLGLAVGDAVGTTVEFMPRGSFEPVTDMVGGGPFNLKAGEWTDDTSMALCLGASLLACNGFDAADQMDRYVRWYKEGYMSSNGRCFDIGNTVRGALTRYVSSGDSFSGSTDPWSSGNGSIMRLAPIPLFYHPDIDAATQYAADSSRTTHASEECIEACQLFARMLTGALAGESRMSILESDADFPFAAETIRHIAEGRYRSKTIDQICGSGYVVDSLEAVLWCFAMTDSFEDAILTAVNLGDDADTTGAVCGQIAGAYYGMEGIPDTWLDKLVMRREIEAMAEALYRADTSTQ